MGRKVNVAQKHNMPTLYLWDFAINFYFKCSSVWSQKFRGYETHSRFFFYLKHWIKTRAWKCLIKWIMSKGRNKDFMIFITDLTEKIKSKLRVISLWGASPMSGKIKKIWTFNFWWPLVSLFSLPWLFGSWYIFSMEEFQVCLSCWIFKRKNYYVGPKPLCFSWCSSILYILLGGGGGNGL